MLNNHLLCIILNFLSSHLYQNIYLIFQNSQFKQTQFMADSFSCTKNKLEYFT